MVLSAIWAWFNRTDLCCAYWAPRWKQEGNICLSIFFKIPISRTSVLWNIQGEELFRAPAPWGFMCQWITYSGFPAHVHYACYYTSSCPLSLCWLTLNIRHWTRKRLSCAHIKSGGKLPFRPNLKPHRTMLIISLTHSRSAKPKT